MDNNLCIRNCNEIDLNAHAVIEASAGTGKTYTITGIVIRLILGVRTPSGVPLCNLDPLSIDKILLSTFTRAATEEMKRKVRDAMIAAQGDFLNVELIFSCSDFKRKRYSVVRESVLGLCKDFSLEPYIMDLIFELLDYSVRRSMKSGDADIFQVEIDLQKQNDMYKVIHQSRLQLEAAVNDIDKASVVTMHQFCQSMLRKNAFESGVLFKTRLISSIEENRQRAIDFKKRYFLYGKGERSISDYLLYKTLSDLNTDFFKKSGQIVRLDELLNTAGKREFITDARFASMVKNLQKLYLDLRRFFPFPEDVIDLTIVRELCEFANNVLNIKTDRKGNRQTGFLPSVSSNALYRIVYDTVDTKIGGSKSIKKYFDERINDTDFLKNWLDDFRNVFITDKKNYVRDSLDAEAEESPKVDPDALFDYVILWQIRYALSVIRSTDDVLKIRQELTFDDLITDLASAVSESAGSTAEKLLDNIRREFPVAILDEFQDTSSAQYRIFKRVYLDDPSKQTKLFIVGDPKQAIYAFRHADVYTYLEAREQISNHNSGGGCGKTYNLGTNYRSDSDVVNFVNALFYVDDLSSMKAGVSENSSQNEHSNRRETLFDYRTENTAESIRFVESALPESKKSKPPKVMFIHRIDKSAYMNGCVDLSRGDAEILPGLIFSSGEESYTEEFAARNVYYLLTECCRAELADECEDGCSNAGNGEPDRKTLVYRFGESDCKYYISPVKPSDIAVIVRDKRNAADVSSYLSGYGIKSVFLSDKNSVKERRLEVQLLEFFLRVMAFPSDQEGIKKLITCPLIQKSINEMDRYFLASSESSEFILLLRECHDIWTAQSFMAAFFRFIFAPFIALPSRLRFRSDGTRLLTNIMHLAEIIQKKAVELPSKYAVYNWFSRLKTGDTDNEGDVDSDEEDKIRAENQKDVVKILTMHYSKGLEYPIVINPFLSYSKDSSNAKRSRKSNLFSYHEKNANGAVQSAFKISNSCSEPEETEGEQKDEYIRLLYVALTRARHINWIDTRNNGKGTNASNSGKGYLWELLNRRYGNTAAGNEAQGCKKNADTDKQTPTTADYWAEFIREFNDCKTTDGNRRFRSIELNPGSGDESGNCMKFPLYEEISADPQKISAAEFNGKIDRSWKITSYSSLFRHSVSSSEKFVPVLLKDDESDTEDEAAGADSNRSYQLDRFHFPHGSASGTFLHHILEVIPFFSKVNFHSESEYSDMLRERMEREVGISYFANSSTLKKWKEKDGVDSLCRWFDLITRTPLKFGEKIFSLSDISAADKLPEVKFTFSLGRIHIQYLNDYLNTLYEKNQWPVHGEINDGGEITGFLSGVIDLFFKYDDKYYVLDYKSNFISDKSVFYNEENMILKIAESRYDMQYVIYTLAAYRFLKNRIPDFNFEKDFGGIMYLFIRGIDDAWSSGGGKFSTTGGFYRNLAELGNGFIESVDNIFNYSGSKNV